MTIIIIYDYTRTQTKFGRYKSVIQQAKLRDARLRVQAQVQQGHFHALLTPLLRKDGATSRHVSCSKVGLDLCSN